MVCFGIKIDFMDSGSNFTNKITFRECSFLVLVSYPYQSIVLFSSIFSLQVATASAACICLEIKTISVVWGKTKVWDLLYYIWESVWYDCDHYDDGYQQNYTSGTDLFDILSKKKIISPWKDYKYFNDISTWQLRPWLFCSISAANGSVTFRLEGRDCFIPVPVPDITESSRTCKKRVKSKKKIKSLENSTLTRGLGTPYPRHISVIKINQQK